jgi:hypothetical protein
MPRGQYNRNKTALVPKGIVKAEMFTTLPWWDKLTAHEQSNVIAEGQKLAQSMLTYGQARLQVGEHLAALQGILEPHNLFGKFLKTFRFSVRTAYRYIAGYKNASARLPQAVLTAAMARGVNIVGDSEEKPLGVYTKAAEALPPPTNPNPVQAETWLTQLEVVRKQNRETPTEMPAGDPEVLKREVVRFASLRFERLPQHKRTREAWAKQVVGLLMTKFGISTPQSFTPLPVPEEYQVHRGRPRSIAANAA